MRPPNLLILMPDQLRADALGCAGNPNVSTPHLDRLAREGVRFSHACTTNPLCMPARASFLTGLHSRAHGVRANAGGLPARAASYLHPLRRAGYHTCHLGKSHLYPHTEVDRLGRWRHRRLLRALGLEQVREVTGPRAAVHVGSILTERWERRGLWGLYREDAARRQAAGALESTWPSPLPEGEGLDDFVASLALEFLESYGRRRPFVTFVGFGGPHPPLDPPLSWARRYEGREVDAPAPPAEPGAHVPPLAAAFQRHLQGHFSPTPEQARNVRAAYYAKVSHIDDLVGRILQALERLDLLDETAILVWSDHGEMLLDHGRLGKSVLYEPAVRVPVVLRLPEAAYGGTVVDAPVSIVDAFPTLLELAGCALPAGLPGRSLLPLARDPLASHHDAVFAEVLGDDGFGAAQGRPPFPHRELVRDARFKLVRAGTGEPLALFDLRDDPDERENLLGAAGTGKELQRLTGLLDGWGGGMLG